MKKINLLWFVIILITFGISSCSKDEDEEASSPPPTNDSLILNFTAFGGGDTVEFRKVFKDPLGRDQRIERLYHYVSNIYLLDGNSENLIEDVELIVYEDNGVIDPGNSRQKIKLSVPTGTYTGIKLGIGLDPVQNASDPTSFPDEHPLSANQLTYWSTWQKYKFIVIEGRIDTNNSGSLTNIFSYHTGFDEMYREKTFNKTIDLKGGSRTELNFTFEVNEIFFGNDTLDVAVNNSWHGDTATLNRAVIISDNFINSLTVE